MKQSVNSSGSHSIKVNYEPFVNFTERSRANLFKQRKHRFRIYIPLITQ